MPDGYTPLGKGSQAYAAPDESETSADVAAPASTPEKAPLGNVELVAFGVLGGIYLLFTVGWIIGGLRLQDVAVFLVSPAAYVPAFVLAALAPAIWFVTTYLLTRRSHAWLRFTWLIVGVVLLVPWPFIMVGALGQ
nr:DNA polymerase III subunit gamma/tau [Microbacterium invictum]